MDTTPGKTNRQDGVSAVPSGSGLTFLMDSSYDEEDNPSTLVPAGFEPEPEKGRIRPGAAMEDDGGGEDDEDQDIDDNEEDSDVTEAKRGRELTDKYLAGQ